MRVLLVGGNGFIGSHVQDALIRSGCYVRVLDRASERYRAPLPGVDHHVGSPSDTTAISEALAGMDSVVYMAGTTVPSTSNANVSWDIESNLTPLIATLETMTRVGVTRLVFISSGGTIYGVTDRCPTPECAPTDPICSYGIVKLASEKYLGMYQHLYDVQPRILRPSNVFGPREGHQGVQGFISTNLLRLLKDEPIEIWGDGRVVRDYLYVEDLSQAVLLALENPTTGPVNVGSGEGRSLLEVVDTLTEVTGKKPDIRYLDARAFDVPTMILDNSVARKTLGWRPTTRFADGVARHWQWLRDQFGD